MCVKGRDGEAVAVEKIRYEHNNNYLRINFNFEKGKDLANFNYSTEGGVVAFDRLSPANEIFVGTFHGV